MDANWIVGHGIPAITFGAGQRKVHTTDEWIDKKIRIVFSPQFRLGFLVPGAIQTLHLFVLCPLIAQFDGLCHYIN